MDHSWTKLSCNWSHIGGCSFPKCVQELAADPDVFIKPDINKLVQEEKSILLSREQSSEFCELQVNKFPHYKIQAVSFVCNVAKVEIFQGTIKEYVETVYGFVVDDTDEEFKSYRYDVEIQKSGVTDLTLRFLTNSSEVCIFGIMLHISPNPNGITSLLPPNCCLKTQDVSQLETNENTASGNCGELLKLLTNSAQSYALPLDQQLEQKLKFTDDERGISNANTTEEIVDKLKFHIDERLKEFEIYIKRSLAEIEQRQNQKLDKILYILENKN